MSRSGRPIPGVRKVGEVRAEFDVTRLLSAGWDGGSGLVLDVY